MTDATRRFDPLADDYARFRPGYPRALVAALRAARGLPQGAHVADVGCGTGLLAVPFLDDGCRVTGIEPSPAMRAHAQAALGAHPGFRLLMRTAAEELIEEEGRVVGLRASAEGGRLEVRAALRTLAPSRRPASGHEEPTARAH